MRSSAASQDLAVQPPITQQHLVASPLVTFEPGLLADRLAAYLSLLKENRLGFISAVADRSWRDWLWNGMPLG